MNNFQILKDNKDGTFDIEVPVYTRITIEHPVDSSGAKLTSSSLVHFLNNWVIEHYPNTTGGIDPNVSEFNNENGLNTSNDNVLDILSILDLDDENSPTT